ncbi:hypothetical protein ACF05L_32870 [Streptomyces bobili]
MPATGAVGGSSFALSQDTKKAKAAAGCASGLPYADPVHPEQLTRSA